MENYKNWLIERFMIERKRFGRSGYTHIHKERWLTIPTKLKEVH